MSWRTAFFSGALASAHLGADSERRLTCSVTTRIEPATPLLTFASGLGFFVSLPSAGTLEARLLPRRAKRLRAAATSPATTTRLTVEEGSAVRIVPRLNRADRRRLQQTRRLGVSVRLTFTPKVGAQTVSTQRLTLRRIVRPPRACPPSKPEGPRKRPLRPRRC